MTVNDYRHHLYRLAETHQIQVTETIGGPRDIAQADIKLRSVILPQIVDDTSYAQALHEFGHIIAPDGHGYSHGCCPKCCQQPMYVYDLLKEEFAAWAWAREQAIEWTVGMEQTEKICLMSYLQQLDKAREAAGLPKAA